MNPVLERWNTLDPAAAAREILPCCGSGSWAAQLAAKRPIVDEQSLLANSNTIWFSLPEAAWQEAFDSHPRIGQQKPQSHATEESLRWSAHEQRTALSQAASAQQAL